MTKTNYYNVVVRNKEGTLILSSSGVAFKPWDEKQAIVLVRWEHFQRYELNKVSAAMAMIKIVIQEQQDVAEEEIIVKMKTLEESEKLLDDIKMRMDDFEERQKKLEEGFESEEYAVKIVPVMSSPVLDLVSQEVEVPTTERKAETPEETATTDVVNYYIESQEQPRNDNKAYQINQRNENRTVCVRLPRFILICRNFQILFGPCNSRMISLCSLSSIRQKICMPLWRQYCCALYHFHPWFHSF